MFSRCSFLSQRLPEFVRSREASFPETPCWRGLALRGAPLELDSVKKVAITSDAWHPRHLS